MIPNAVIPVKWDNTTSFLMVFIFLCAFFLLLLLFSNTTQRKIEISNKFVGLSNASWRNDDNIHVGKLCTITIGRLFICYSHRDSDHDIFMTPASCYLFWFHLEEIKCINYTGNIKNEKITNQPIETGTVPKFLSNDGNRLCARFSSLLIHLLFINWIYLLARNRMGSICAYLLCCAILWWSVSRDFEEGIWK